MTSYTREQLEAWLKTIKVKGNVLDIGGGVQTLEGRVKSFEPTIYNIMDNCSEEGLHEKWIEPDIVWDICEGHVEKSEKGLYDQIFMIEVSEYLKNPIAALKNIYSLLKKGGEFYSSWHFIYPMHPPVGRDYFRYTPYCVDMLLQDAGFEIEQHSLREATTDLERVWSAERMRGWKDFDNSIVGSLVKCKK